MNIQGESCVDTSTKIQHINNTNPSIISQSGCFKESDKLNLPNFPVTMNTSDNNLTEEFYEKCFEWASYYDRAVGYFTSSWIRDNAGGLSKFAINSGNVRWIISPILGAEDLKAVESGFKFDEENQKYQNILDFSLDELKKNLETDTINTVAWMVYDEILEFRFAVPKKDLHGDFHDKFGIFTDNDNNSLSFNGSINDSAKGNENYESIKIFRTWTGLNDFVEDDKKRFQKLWDDEDPNVSVLKLPDAIKKKIFELRSDDRPYKKPEKNVVINKWRHQDEAVEAFIREKNGILEMATGTGKTKTAISIINKLIQTGEISTVVVTVDGTDLLDQWYKILLLNTNLKGYRYYESHKELAGFLLNNKGSFLLVSRNEKFLSDALGKIKKNTFDSSIIICDEIHGLGSNALVRNLSGKIVPFKYRLGLSATPEREYDEVGNQFIEAEVGRVIYRFSIEDAIKRGILCEFNYFPFEYELTEEDRENLKKIIAAFHAKRQAGEFVDENLLYTQLAAVRKLSPAKIPIFRDLVKRNPQLLDRCIIFVETKEFGVAIQNIIINHVQDYHTYYGEDDRINLTKFANGEFKCLITSKRISEGIDIQSVNNIILLSADRAKLQTIQRIGRSLRIDPHNPEKKAAVVDFICISNKENLNDAESNSDIERKEWLEAISLIRKEE
jgi:superfamily II DNA or RNA helicase